MNHTLGVWGGMSKPAQSLEKESVCKGDDGSQFSGNPLEPGAEGGPVDSSPVESRDQQCNVSTGGISEISTKLLKSQLGTCSSQ